MHTQIIAKDASSTISVFIFYFHPHFQQLCGFTPKQACNPVGSLLRYVFLVSVTTSWTWFNYERHGAVSHHSRYWGWKKMCCVIFPTDGIPSRHIRGAAEWWLAIIYKKTSRWTPWPITGKPLLVAMAAHQLTIEGWMVYQCIFGARSAKMSGGLCHDQGDRTGASVCI